jgi:hypothetical protein
MVRQRLRLLELRQLDDPDPPLAPSGRPRQEPGSHDCLRGLGHVVAGSLPVAGRAEEDRAGAA